MTSGKIDIDADGFQIAQVLCTFKEPMGAKEIVDRSYGRLKLSPWLYSRLSALVSAGFAESEQESIVHAHVGFKRWLYKITPRGREYVISQLPEVDLAALFSALLKEPPR